MQGTQCVSACSAGYYGNSETRKCERCLDNCQLCINANSCIFCDEGRVYIDG